MQKPDVKEIKLRRPFYSLKKHYIEAGKFTGDTYVGTCVRDGFDNYMNWAVLDRRV